MNKCLCGIYNEPCPYCKDQKKKIQSVEYALKQNELFADIRISLHTKDGVEIVVGADVATLKIENSSDIYWGRTATIQLQCFPSMKTSELFNIQII